MKRISGMLAITALMASAGPLAAAAPPKAATPASAPKAVAAQSDCAPLLATGQTKGIKFGKDAKKTGLIGAIGGAVVGGIFALSTSDDENKTGDVAQGVAIGAAVGGAVGVGIGQIAEKRRAAFESESAYLACEINYADEELALREKQVAAAELELAAAKSEAEVLRAKIAANQAKAKELRALSNSWKKKIEQLDRELEAWDQQIQYFNALASRTEAAPGESTKALAKRRQELARKKGALQTQYNRLAGIRDEYIVQRNVVGKG
jgi:hypothetical protein